MKKIFSILPIILLPLFFSCSISFLSKSEKNLIVTIEDFVDFSFIKGEYNINHKFIKQNIPFSKTIFHYVYQDSPTLTSISHINEYIIFPKNTASLDKRSRTFMEKIIKSSSDSIILTTSNNRYGTTTDFYTVVSKDNTPIGNIISITFEKAYFFFYIQGIYFESLDQYDPIISPKIKRIAKYST